MNKMLWIITALCSFAAALVGILNPVIYSKVINSEIMPAVMGQDLMTVLAAILILILAVLTKAGDSKKQVIILGILGYLFYAYGIYVVERIYNVLYYLYIVIFGLSFWSLVYGVLKIRGEDVQIIYVPALMRNISAGFSFLVALVFTILWVMQLLPLVITGEKIEFMYSIYILDLCFIMPAFVIVGVLVLRKARLGLLLVPAMFVLGFTLIFSLVLSESLKPLFNDATSVGGIIPNLVLSLLFLVLACLYLWKLKFSH
jgi:hypothetical protein